MIVNAIRYFLLGFGAIALLVGAFVIFNTLSITVAQRTREYATLRTSASFGRRMTSFPIDGLNRISLSEPTDASPSPS